MKIVSTEFGTPLEITSATRMSKNSSATCAHKNRRRTLIPVLFIFLSIITVILRAAIVVLGHPFFRLCSECGELLQAQRVCGEIDAKVSIESVLQVDCRHFPSGLRRLAQP